MVITHILQVLFGIFHWLWMVAQFIVLQVIALLERSYALVTLLLHHVKL